MIDEQKTCKIALTTLLVVVVASCGAKTGLLIDDAGTELDAEVIVHADAEVEADVELDADVCVDQRVDFELRRGEVIFVIDRSWSMAWSLEGDYEAPIGFRRWDLLHEALATVLPDAENLLEMGAKFYPYEDMMSCEAPPGVELPPAPFNTSEILDIIDRSTPGGGTPTAWALEYARDYFVENPRPGVARFIVLTTDGGPNCNPDAYVPGETCICTGVPEDCATPELSEFNCLDAEHTLDVIESTYAAHDIPVYVIGIDGSFRSDLVDFLDQMAVAGGRPRSEPGERQFYSIRREGDLTDAFDTITSTIARCVFTVSPVLSVDWRMDVSVDGQLVLRDAGQRDGWDWTSLLAGEVTFFGSACDRVSAPGARVRGVISCPGDE